MRRARSPLASLAGIGLGCGGAAALLWPLHARAGLWLEMLYAAALAGACACGTALLAATAIDMGLRRRSARLRPVRVFDLALGALLALPSGAALADLLPNLAAA